MVGLGQLDKTWVVNHVIIWLWMSWIEGEDYKSEKQKHSWEYDSWNLKQSKESRQNQSELTSSHSHTNQSGWDALQFMKHSSAIWLAMHKVFTVSYPLEPGVFLYCYHMTFCVRVCGASTIQRFEASQWLIWFIVRLVTTKYWEITHCFRQSDDMVFN